MKLDPKELQKNFKRTIGGKPLNEVTALEKEWTCM
jgi:hypothetical protein